MDLRQLESLIAVGDHGSFSAAAETLLTVQSNVSTRVARLEAELGAVLVDRNSRRLTAEGEVVVKRAREILGAVAAIPSDLASLRDQIIGDVKLGMIASTARWLVPHLLTYTRQTLPDVELQISESTSNAIGAAVAHGELDIGVVNLPVDRKDLDPTPLLTEEIFLVLPKDHPLAKRKDLSIEDLAEVELFAPPRGSSYRDGLEAAFARAELSMKVTNEFEGIRLIESLAQSGIGAAFLPATATPLNHTPAPFAISGIPPRSVGAITRTQRQLAIATGAVLDALVSVVRAQAPAMRGVRLPEGAQK